MKVLVKMLVIAFILSSCSPYCFVTKDKEQIYLPSTEIEKIIKIFPVDISPVLNNIYQVSFIDDTYAFTGAYIPCEKSIYFNRDYYQDALHDPIQGPALYVITMHEIFHYYQNEILNVKDAEFGLYANDIDYYPELGKDSYALEEEANMFAFCVSLEFHASGDPYYLPTGERITDEQKDFYISYINALGFSFEEKENEAL
jgi:hypothetical protein